MRAYCYTHAAGNLPEASKWNNTGRGYPDVSALGGEGNPYCVVVGSLPRSAFFAMTSLPLLAFARVDAHVVHVCSPSGHKLMFASAHRAYIVLRAHSSYL